MLQKKDLYIFYSVSFLKSCVFMVPVWYFFFTVYLNFGLSEAIFLGIFSGIIQAIFEIPSGAWADRLGRKRNFIIGMLLYLLAFSIYLMGSHFWHFIILGSIYGIASAMTSGNVEAIIHDKLGYEAKSEKIFNHIQSRQYILLFLGRAGSCGIAGYLFLLDPLYPVIGTLICYCIALILFLFFKAGNQEKSQSKNNFLHIKEALLWFLGNKTESYMLMFGGFLLIGLGNIYWFSYQAYFYDKDISIGYIGIMYSIVAISSAIGSYSIGVIQLKYNSIIIMRLLFILFLVSSIGLRYMSGIFIIFPVLLLSYIFGFIEPLVKSYLIKTCPGTHKSTIFSIFSLVVTIGYFICSSVAGYFGEIYGLEKVYFYLIFIILGVIILDNFYIQKKIKI